MSRAAGTLPPGTSPAHEGALLPPGASGQVGATGAIDALPAGGSPARAGSSPPAGALTQAKAYPGIDRFRLLAALLVVAIHTSPLLSLSPTADFFLTRVAARVAVPFFFMATGFFLLPRACARGPHSNKPLLSFIKRTAVLYAAAVVLYLPVNLYAGHFEGAGPGTLLRMLLTDGTLYHLWYLPAVITGAALVWAALRRLPLWLVAALAGVLYLVGLGGDSYYGLAAQWPWLREFYGGIFTVSSYTRNGLFFAPLFLTLGALAATRPPKTPVWLRAAGLAAALAAMAAEAWWLRPYARHDSMTLLLPVCCWLLFGLVARPVTPCPATRRLARRRPVAMWVYLLHPMVIVALRAAVKLSGFGRPLVENSLMHYAAVSMLSLAAAVLLTMLAGPGGLLARRAETRRLRRAASNTPPAPVGVQTASDSID